MVSRIDLGPDGGPYVEIDEDAGDLVIRVPNDTVDFDSNDLLNAVLQNATMDGGSLDGVSLASALDADTQEIQNANLQNATLSDALDANNQDLNSVGTASVTALEAEAVSTDLINNIEYYVEDDSSLDDALASASAGDTIRLGPSTFGENRTINTSVQFVGSSGGVLEGTIIDAVWTIDSRGTVIRQINRFGADAEINVNRNNIGIHNALVSSSDAEINIGGNECVITEMRSLNVTFESETSAGIVDSSIGLTVTDNGNNTVGDIA